MAAFPETWPDGAARTERTGTAMDVILHIGAHLCATTTFQDYLRRNRADLSAAVWDPRRTRHGLFAGLLPDAASAPKGAATRRAVGRIRLNLARCAEAGTPRLIVSDPAMMGTLRANLRMGTLYCGLGERMARLGQAFEGYPVKVALNIRALDTYWAAALAQAITGGHGLPAPQRLVRLAETPRSWRDVIEELACALPGAELRVLPFEVFGGRPEAQLAAIVPGPVPTGHARGWLNATPRLPELRAWLGPEAAALPAGGNRWQPFTEAQGAALREIYADDMMWLAGGAGGLARLADDPDKTDTQRTWAGAAPPQQDLTRGRRDEQEDGGLAGTG